MNAAAGRRRRYPCRTGPFKKGIRKAPKMRINPGWSQLIMMSPFRLGNIGFDRAAVVSFVFHQKGKTKPLGDHDDQNRQEHNKHRTKTRKPNEEKEDEEKEKEEDDDHHHR